MQTPVAINRTRRFAPIIAIVGLFLALSGWALSSPLGSSPDENFHLASTWCAWGEKDGVCESTGSPDTRLIPWQLVEGSCYSFEPNVSASCQNQIPNENVRGLALSTHGNFQHNYPPVFYSVMHLFVSDNLELSVLTMRMLNSLLFCLVLVSTWLLVSQEKRQVLVWMWAGTLVPLSLFLIPSVNPSSWAIIAVGSSWLVLDSFFKNSDKQKIYAALLYIFLVIMAAGARGDSAVYVCLTSLLVIFMNLKRLSAHKIDLLLPLIMTGVAALLFFSSAQASVASSGLYSGGEVPVWNLTEKINLLIGNGIQLPALWAGIFGMSSIGSPAVSIGNLGWLDTQMPMLVWLPALAVFISLCYVGFSKLSRTKIFALFILFVALVVIPLYVLQKSFATVGAEVQPRYLLPLIVVFLGIALVSPTKSPIKVFNNKTQHVLLIASLVIANLVAVHFLMRRFITGNDVRSANLNAGIEWWWTTVPLQPMSVWIGTSMFFAVALIAGSIAVLQQKRVGINSLV